MKSTLLIAIIIGTCLSVELSLTTRCSCNEFDATLCAAAPYCTIIDGICSPNQCKSLQPSECTALYSEYQCKWNYQKEICEDHVYECSELDTLACFQKVALQECYYDTVDYSCKAYGECTLAKSADACHPLDCSYTITEGCQDTSSSLYCNGTSSCRQWNKDTQCQLNDINECTLRDRNFEQCTDFENGFMNKCDDFCIDVNNKCVQRSCQDFTTSETCLAAINLMDFTTVPCFWSNSSCNEATNQELEDMGVGCLEITFLNYKWNSDSGKCSACESVEDNPLFSGLKKLLDKLSYSIILDVILISSIMLN